MPVLPPEFISSWYLLQDQNLQEPASQHLGTFRLVESWSEKQIISTRKRILVQGDIGTHVMEIGGMTWETTVSSPIIVFENPTGESGSGSTSLNFVGASADYTVSSLYSLLLSSFNNIYDPTLTLSATTLLTNGELTFGEKGVDCRLTFKTSAGIADENSTNDGTGSGVFIAYLPTTILPGGYDAIARTAMYYDTTLIISNGSADFLPYSIIEGSIKVNVDVKENYFINTSSQRPYLAAQGYHVTGTLKLLAIPTGQAAASFETDSLTNYPVNPLQKLNPDEQNIVNNTTVPPNVTPTFNTTLSGGAQFSITALQIADLSIPFYGDTQIINAVERSLPNGGISTVDLSFDCFVRYIPGSS